LQNAPIPCADRKTESSCFNNCSGGSILRSRETAGLKLAELTYSSGLRLPLHSHKRAHFCLLLHGTYEETCGRRSLVRRPGSLAFVAGGVTHSNLIHRSGIRFFALEMTRPWLERVNGHTSFEQSSTQYESGPLPWLAMRLYGEFRSGDNLAPLAIEGLALELLAGFGRQSARISENGSGNWLKKAKDLLHQRFHQPLTLVDVADFVDVHPVSLARAFRRAYHCTVGEYVRKLRIESACQKLLTSDAPMVEIAFSAGFSEQSHFCRTFKRLTGLTPSEYRSSSGQG
jgi:AraC family transcriptional regulator